MLPAVSSNNSAEGALHTQPPAPLCKESLERLIDELEHDLADGSWEKNTYARSDLEMMSALVNLANIKKPAMNIEFVTRAQDLGQAINNAMEGAITSARFITNLGEDGIHFSVIDYKMVDKKASLILFEPANFTGSGPILLTLRADSSLSRNTADYHFCAVEMDIQRSISECGMFSLALAKKLHREASQLDALHQDNIKGVLLSKGEFYLPHTKLDPYLPVTFYKHTQGRHRLNEYLKANPEREQQKVNKKEETILPRFEKNVRAVGDKQLSSSIHQKRIVELTALLKSL